MREADEGKVRKIERQLQGEHFAVLEPLRILMQHLHLLTVYCPAQTESSNLDVIILKTLIKRQWTLQSFFSDLLSADNFLLQR